MAPSIYSVGSPIPESSLRCNKLCEIGRHLGPLTGSLLASFPFCRNMLVF